MNFVYKITLHVNLHILYNVYIKTSSKIQKYQNPSSTSKVIKKSLNSWKNIISFELHLNFKSELDFQVNL